MGEIKQRRESIVGTGVSVENAPVRTTTAPHLRALELDGAQPAGRRTMKVRSAPRWRECLMSLSTLRRYLAAGVLIAILAAASAAPANARDLTSAGGAWLWLQDVWTQSFSALWSWPGHEVPSRASSLVPIVGKQGLGLDPNGISAPTGPDSPTPACSSCGDGRLGLDPNG
jgi:hypothetical protein